jgi:ankyrin
VTKLAGNRVAVSPIVTVEPRRRKFHKPITLTIPVPQAAARGMINQYNGDAPTLRLLCSITGGLAKAQWEDVTGSTPLTFVNNCVSFTTTVSARFWLIDCRQVAEATKYATDIYLESVQVPFMAKFVIFCKRHETNEAQLRVFCMTDDKEDKTLETQERFEEIAKSRDVEVLENKPAFVEFAGNLHPVMKSGEQLNMLFQAFRENRLPFLIRVRDSDQEPIGRIAFMRDPRQHKNEPPQTPICNLNLKLPAVIDPSLDSRKSTPSPFRKSNTNSKSVQDLNLPAVAREVGMDWYPLAQELDVTDKEVTRISNENSAEAQSLALLQNWHSKLNPQKNPKNILEKALKAVGRDDIVAKYLKSSSPHVADSLERAIDSAGRDQEAFENLREEIGSRGTSGGRDLNLVNLEDRDFMKVQSVPKIVSPTPHISVPQDPDSLESESESAPNRPQTNTKDEAAIHSDSDRAEAVQKLLQFLHEEDKEDSAERARNRGESVSERGLFVLKEQVPIPAASDADDRE